MGKLYSKKVILAILAIVLVVGVIVFRNSGLFDTKAILAFLHLHPFLAPFSYIILYAMMVILFIPTLPMNLGAGFLWGTWLGGPIASLGATLGAVVAFVIARYLAHDYINRKFTHSAWVGFKDLMQKNDWKVMLFMRANPAFPFGVVSYFLGLTPVTFRTHLWTTWLAIIPGTFVFAAVGHSLGGVILGEDGSRILREVIIASLALTALIVGQIALKRYFKKRSLNALQTQDSPAHQEDSRSS